MNMFTILLAALLTQNSASVEGVVVKMGVSEPLAEANVELKEDRGPDAVPRISQQGPQEPLHFTARTAQDGKFVISGVPPGHYRLIATRSNGGYLPAEYGQRSATTQGIAFDLSDGQKLTGIQLAMAPTGSISGRIYDRDGEPVGRAQVQALRSVYRDGHRTLTIVQAVETNDRGEYRLFWLAPGRYYVSAKPDIPQVMDLRSPLGATISAVRVTDPARFGAYEQGSTPVLRKRTLKTGETIEETHVPIYYPGTKEAQEATPVAVGAGTTVGGIDMSVDGGAVITRHIRGRVINAEDGQPLARVSVTAVARKSEPTHSLLSGQSDANGFYDIPGAAPGSYLLSASDGRGYGMVSVEVADADIQNVAMVIMRAFSVSGRFHIEGLSRTGTEPKLADLRVNPFIRDPVVFGSPNGGPSYLPQPLNDGTFSLDGISAGDFRITIRGVPADGYVKSIRLGNTDVLESGLHLSGKPEETLEITIGANAGLISGSVVNARQETLSNRTVVLVPDPRRRQRSDLYKTVSTDSTGQFRFRGITPGDYELFSWEEVETGAWQDPGFIRDYESRGKFVHISEGNNENVQLAVIP